MMMLSLIDTEAPSTMCINCLKFFLKMSVIFEGLIEYEIIGEGSQISTNQKRENSAFSHLIG